MNHRRTRSPFLSFFSVHTTLLSFSFMALCTLGLVLPVSSTESFAAQRDPDQLWISLAPTAAPQGVQCDVHGTPQPQQARGNRQTEGQSQGRGRKPSRFESEHRPTPVRTYYLQGSPISRQAKAYLLHADGVSEELPIIFSPQPKLVVKTPIKDEGMHGANNIYVVDKQVKNSVLTVRVAKWLTMHHSCGWGHDYRNDPSRLQALSLPEIPLDIVVNGLWNGNFHVETKSGDLLQVTTMLDGAPHPGIALTLTTEKEWSRTTVSGPNGETAVQLIRDYYPDSWSGFKRSTMGQFTVAADYLVSKSGTYQDQPYDHIRYISTFPWKYTPASQDYASYGYGLAIATAAMALSGFGVYTYRDRRRKSYTRIDLDA